MRFQKILHVDTAYGRNVTLIKQEAGSLDSVRCDGSACASILTTSAFSGALQLCCSSSTGSSLSAVLLWLKAAPLLFSLEHWHFDFKSREFLCSLEQQTRGGCCVWMPTCLCLACLVAHTSRAEKEAGPYSQIRTKSALFPSHSGRNDCVGQCGRMNHAMCPVHMKPMLFVSGHMEVPGESCQSGGTELAGTTGQLESNADLCIHPG